MGDLALWIGWAVVASGGIAAAGALCCGLAYAGTQGMKRLRDEVMANYDLYVLRHHLLELEAQGRLLRKYRRERFEQEMAGADAARTAKGDTDNG